MMTDIENMDYTVTAAAEFLGCSASRVYQLLEIGRLLPGKDYVVGGPLTVDGDSLMALKRERKLNPPRRGRKPKASPEAPPLNPTGR